LFLFDRSAGMRTAIRQHPKLQSCGAYSMMNTRALITSDNAPKKWLERVWADAKRWRHVPIGPISLSFKFGRRWSPRQAISNTSWYNVLSLDNDHLLAKQRVLGSDEIEHGPAVVVGVGPGCGEAAASLFARRGLRTALVSRSSDALNAFAQTPRRTGASIHAYPCNITDERLVISMMRRIEEELGTPQLLVYAIQSSTPGSVLDASGSAFEECWRANCFGGFLVGREAARRMIRKGRGTIIFTGSTSGTVGRPGYVNFAPGKFGLRALAQVMARELWGHGIHVAHVVIDGDIAEGNESDGDPHIDPTELAELFLSLHTQPRSCWSSEVDVRPAAERFWEHC
jgi:NAD(P)-dependent dehydrogenase (short-subunit alcohol dehydrogenase family)